MLSGKSARDAAERLENPARGGRVSLSGLTAEEIDTLTRLLGQLYVSIVMVGHDPVVTKSAFCCAYCRDLLDALERWDCRLGKEAEQFPSGQTQGIKERSKSNENAGRDH